MVENEHPERVRFYRDLHVWQRGIELTLAVYKVTANFPKQELYGLTSKLRKAAVSIPSNIAEGHGRNTKRDYRQFLSIARGSNLELQTQLFIAEKLGFGAKEDLDNANALSTEVNLMLSALIRKLSPSI